MSYKTDLLNNINQLENILGVIVELPNEDDIERPTGILPNEFTNVLHDSETTFTPEYRLSSSLGNTALLGAFIVQFKVPAGKRPIFRFRGFTPYNAYAHHSTDNGQTWTYGELSSSQSYMDEYGDMVWITSLGTSAVTVDTFMKMTLIFTTTGSTNSSLTDELIRSHSNAIMTIDEVIGNIDPTIISFTIDGVEYKAKEGMTWTEWVDSEYNTIGACIIAENLYIPNDTNGYNNVNNAESSDIIVSGLSYIFSGGSLEEEFQ